MKLVLICTALFFSSILMAKTNPNEFTLTLTEKGFEPSSLKVKSGTPVTLKITRKTNATCAREIMLPSQQLKVELPLNKEVTVKVASLEKGEIKFGCAMNLMVGGVMIAE